MKRASIAACVTLLLVIVIASQQRVTGTQVAAGNAELADELRAGDVVAVSSARNSDAGWTLTSVTLPAGVDPLAYGKEEEDLFLELNDATQRRSLLQRTDKQKDEMQRLSNRVAELEATAKEKFPEGRRHIMQVERSGKDFVRLRHAGSTVLIPHSAIRRIILKATSRPRPDYLPYNTY